MTRQNELELCSPYVSFLLLPELMADDPSPPNEPPRGIPKGMRVERSGSAKRAVSRLTLFLKKREIPDAVASEKGSGAGGLKGQLPRLEPAKKLEKPGKPVDAGWGEAEVAQHGPRMVLWALALVVPVLAIVTAFVLITDERPEKPFASELNFNFNLVEEDNLDLSGPTAWFEEDPHASYVGAIDILDRLNQSGEVAHEVFRRQDFAIEEISNHGLGWNSEFMTADPRTFKWTVADTNNVGFLVLEGLRRDQSVFRSYFVDSSEGLRMDWAASTGWGEVPPADLSSALEKREVMIRCTLDKQPHFDSKVDGSRSWFLIILPGSEKQLWGFAPAGSPLDRDLLELFNFGKFFLDREQDVRVAVQVGKGEGTLKENQVEIIELLAGEWVLP